jgi:hypothetical protein
MTEKITYYAIVDEFSSREHPGGVLRRIENDERQVDEAFTSDQTWEFSPLLYAFERGDTMFEFVPIDQAEAERIVARIRSEAATEE